MKQYKLINRKTKEEIVCTKVEIEGFDYYVNDDEPYPYAYLKHKNEIIKVNGIGEESGEVFHDRGFNFSNECQKVIATTFNIESPEYVRFIIPHTTHQFKFGVMNSPSELLNLSPNLNNPSIDLPQIVDEAENLYPTGKKSIMPMATRNEYDNSLRQEGWNKAKETYQFSEENMIEFMNFESEWLQNNKYRNAYFEYKPYGIGKDVSRKELLDIWIEQQTKILHYE